MKFSYGVRMFSAVVFSLFIGGCATLTSSPDVRNDIKIVKNDSYKGHIGNVQVYAQDGITVVQGSVVRRTSSRILNGHVHVDMVDNNGTRVASTVAFYRLNRPGLQSARAATFTTALQLSAPPEAALIVSHHDAHATEHARSATISIQ